MGAPQGGGQRVNEIWRIVVRNVHKCFHQGFFFLGATILRVLRKWALQVGTSVESLLCVLMDSNCDTLADALLH